MLRPKLVLLWQYPFAAPVLINFFETILSWPVNHLVVSAGVSHISLWSQEIQPREWEKKNKRTIWAWVNSKCKKGGSVTLHSLCICRLSLTCSFREISTRLIGMPTHLWPSSSLLTVVDSGLRTHLFCLPHCPWTGLFSCPLSTAPLRHPSPTAYSGFLFPTALTGVSLPTSSLVEDLELRPLFGFAPKQTKGSSAWRTTHIVSHYYWPRSLTFLRNKTSFIAPRYRKSRGTSHYTTVLGKTKTIQLCGNYL